MTPEELIARINAWLALPMYKDAAYLTELSEIYFLITGKRVVCKGCNYTEMKRILKAYLLNPTTVQNQTLIYTQTSTLNIKTMANKDSKYQFTSAARKQTINLQRNGRMKAVTADNLTNEDAEYILNTPRLKKNYGHNIELKPSAEAESDQDDEAELTAARIEYEEVTRQKPGNRKLETLQAEIEAKKAETAAE